MLINRIFPLKKCDNNKKFQVNWYTDSLRRKRQILSSIKLICNLTRNPHHFSTYNAFRKEYNADIINAKKMAYNNYIQFSKSRARESWKVINSEINKSPGITVSPNIPDTFNNYFSSVAGNIINALPKIDQHLISDCTFFKYPISEKRSNHSYEISKKLKFS